jgi:hypothetical protein
MPRQEANSPAVRRLQPDDAEQLSSPDTNSDYFIPGSPRGMVVRSKLWHVTGMGKADE